MRYLSIFLALMLLSGAALASSAPLNKNVETPIMSDTGTANRLGWISIQTIGNATVGPVVADADRLLNDAAWNSTTHINASVFLASVDYSRTITATPNTTITGSLKLTGTDIAGAAITENLTWSASSSIKTSTRAFKTVMLVQGTKMAGDDALIDVGVGSGLGLNTKRLINTTLFATLNDVRASISSTTDNSTVLSLNLLTLGSALSGDPVKIWYIV